MLIGRCNLFRKLQTLKSAERIATILRSVFASMSTGEVLCTLYLVEGINNPPPEGWVGLVNISREYGRFMLDNEKH
jgi:hypothetical protein